MTINLRFWGFCGLLLLLSNIAWGQFRLYPNQSDYKQQTKHNNYLKSNKSGTLTLPFFDDFSQSFLQPDTSKWEAAGGAFVANAAAFSLVQPSQQVASFDGLDANGSPYEFSDVVNTAVGLSDELTSKPINLAGLSPSDSLYLSFFWQLAGRSEAPNEEDSLRLQFKDDTGEWQTLWRAIGNNIPSDTFQIELVGLLENRYFHNEFQFRFQAFGRLSGIYDVWHLDYIYLNNNRGFDDRFVRDLASIKIFDGFLQNYSAMPINQYLVNAAAETNTSIRSTLRNLNDNFNFYAYQVQLRDTLNNTVLDVFTESTPILIDDFETDTLVYNLNAGLITTNNPKVLEYRFEVNTGDDNTVIPPIDLSQNDTIVGYTVLSDYYAYDDGTAEYGAGVNQRFGQVALRFTLNEADTLTDVQMHFTKLERDLTGQTFVLNIYQYINNPEDSILLQRSVPIRYPNERDEFLSLKAILEEIGDNFPAIPLPAGEFYVGWQQTTNDRLTVGYDRSRNSASETFFNVGNGWADWTPQPEEEGSLMVRPIFGEASIITAQEKPRRDAFKIYPNPSKGVIRLEGDYLPPSVQVYDAKARYLGQVKVQQAQLDLQHLPNGLYIIRWQNAQKMQVQQAKILINR